MALHHRVIAAATSGQSHLIVAAVLASFVVWATLQGHLGKYLADLGLGGQAPTLNPAVQSAGAGVLGGGVGSAVGSAIGGLPALPALPGAQSGN